jgi:KaiC/GvpD/RAD55 family RecA-like ATPase
VQTPGSIPHPASVGADSFPAELRDFLSGKLRQTVVVRGAPGVGKTTFALSALAAFSGARIFLTARVPTEVLQRQFAWLGDASTPPIDLVEFVRFRTVPATGILSIEHLRRTLQARAADLIDVSQVINLPPIVADHLDRQPGGPRLIVIDSWEAYVENILGSSAINLDAPTTRWELERSMLDQLLATDSSVLMVVERDARTRFDYIVDGSLLLRSEEVDGREQRWLEITKLRGERIRRGSYPFTLEGARFGAFLGARALPRGPARADPDPAPTSAELWPGSTVFASQFGRLPLNGPLLIETDSETSGRVLWGLVLPMVESSLASGGRVIVRPPVALGPAEVWSSFPHLLPSARLVRSLRIVDAPRLMPSGEAPAEVFLHAESGPVAAPKPGASAGDPPSDLSPEALRALEFLGSAPPEGRNLVVVFPSVREDLDPRHGPDEYLRLLGRARREGTRFSSVVVMTSGDPVLAWARSRAPVHVSIATRRGQVFLFGVRPWTPSFLLDLAEPPVTGGPYTLRAMV